MEKEFEINMVLSNVKDETDFSITVKFVQWVESNGWYCGGTISELDENGETIKIIE